MADKVDIKTLLDGVVLVQNGKVVQSPEKDNYAVHPAVNSPLALMPGQEILKHLKAQFPRAVFTWFAKPMAKDAATAEKKK